MFGSSKVCMVYNKETMGITRFFHFIHSPSRRSVFGEYLKEIVYGANDGIITTFAVVSGFAGASGNVDSTLGVGVVVLFGLANLFADATSMGLGDFLSLRSEQDSYRSARAQEKNELGREPMNKKEETLRLFRKRGYSQEESYRMTDILAKNEELWLDFLMQFKHGESNSEEKPAVNGLVTFISFLIFGTIPLIPYFFASVDADASFVWAVVNTVIALFLLGLLRWRVTRLSPVRSVGEVLILGGLAAVIAYIVGILVG